MKTSTQAISATVAAAAATIGIFALLDDPNTTIDLNDFTIDPIDVSVEVDTGHTSCDFHVIEDTGAGGINILDAACIFISPSGLQKASCMSHSPYSGDRDDGNWTCSVPFPVNSENGDWTIFHLDIRDSDFNTARFTASDLEGNTPTPFPTVVQLTSSVPDTTDPVITEFAVSPSAQEVTTGAGSILCSVTATDANTGMLYTNCTFESPTPGDPVSCTAHVGVDDDWNCTAVIPQSSEIGTWPIVDIRASDVVFNESVLDSTAIAALSPAGDTSFDITGAGGTGGTGGSGGDCGASIAESVVNGWVSTDVASPADGDLDIAVYMQIDDSPTVKEGIFAVADGTVLEFDDAAMLIRFGAGGAFDARDGGGYACDICNITWTKGEWYLIEIAANVQAETYTVDITPCGGSKQTLITDAQFRNFGSNGDMTHHAMWGGVDTIAGRDDVTWTPGTCTPQTCAQQGFTCGTQSDTCGGTATPDPCGTCGGIDVCVGSSCCTPKTLCNEFTPTAECGFPADGCGGTVDCDTPGCTGGDVCQGDNTCAPPSDFPAIGDGITGVVSDYWCPRWATLRTTTTGVKAVGSGALTEYVHNTSGGYNFTANNGLLRCVKATSTTVVKYRMEYGNGYHFGGLLENVRGESPVPSTGGRTHLGGGSAFTMRRSSMYPVYRDVTQNSAGLWVDNYLDTYQNADLSPAAHADVIQGHNAGCGPTYYVHNTMRGDGARDYGNNCNNTPGGYCSNAVLFVKGTWSGEQCRLTASMVVKDNLLDGGLRVSRWSDSSGRIINSAYYNNMWQSDTWYTNGGPCSHAWTNAQYDMVTSPSPAKASEEICVEHDGNNTQTDGDQAQITAECQFNQGAGEVLAQGSCVNLDPVPTTVISNFVLGVTSCTAGQGACNDITLSADVAISEGARAITSSGAWGPKWDDPDTSSLWHEASPGGSERWRYNCGGTTAQTLAPSPCTAGHCLGGYQDDKGDLWYDYPACNGLSSCTMTGVCDYDAESADTYTAKIYAEPGPGAAFRLSDHDEATFTVNP